MTKRPESANPIPQKQPSLLISRQEAEEQIRGRILEGKELLSLQIQTATDLEKGETQKKIWHDYNEELLLRIFDTAKFAEEYSYIGVGFGYLDYSLADGIRDFFSDLNKYIGRLESIKSRLKLIPDANKSDIELRAAPRDVLTNKVFIVHGHDEEAKQSVARMIEKLGLEVVILHEQPNQSRTIIEKFEAHSDVAFAIIVLTPDDIGTSKDNPQDLKPRARQNVILELGYFIGRLGRNRVCALHKGDIEIPTDFSGVIWVPMDQAGRWKFDLGREMKTAGLDIDLNKIV